MATGEESSKFGGRKICSLIGLFAGLVMLAICFQSMGGGHGSYAPLLICFAPVMVSGDIALGLIFGALVYPLYGLVLAICKQRGIGLRAYLAISILHHFCIALNIATIRQDVASYIPRVWNAEGGAAALSLLCALYFGLHLAAIVYVVRRPGGA